MLFQPNEYAVDKAMAVLNEALRQDPRAMRELFSHRELCNSRLAQNDTVQVLTGESGASIGVLGLINGILGVHPNGRGPIAMVVEDNGDVSRFIKTDGGHA